MAHLITGYAGHEHIQSADQGSYNAAFFGGGQYVMESGNQFEASIIDNNTVRVLDGDLLMYGRHVRIEPDTYEDMIIDTGIAGQKRIDLICMTYEKNTMDGTEKAFLEVIKGIGTEGTVKVPDYTDGNILTGASKNQMPLYRINIEGVVLSNITPLFTTIPTYKTLAERYAAQFEATITALKAANILDTVEEIDANTQNNMFAGALALKEHLAADNPHGVSKVDTATKLETARTFRVNLASTTTSAFDGTANVTPGVSGILGVGNGGTGVGTLAELISKMIIFRTTEVTIAIPANSQETVTLTPPEQTGFTFYPVQWYTGSTANVTVQSLSNSSIRVFNNMGTEKMPTFVIRWIGILSK